jgi:RNA polymerase sigma factor (sigma-70 family)
VQALMAQGPDLFETLRDLAAVPNQRSDAELIERFLATRDEEAFTILLRRHGPLVWGVCRRVLGRLHDVEDAFQATFLVLARKAKSIRRRTSLRCWLHGVALRVSRRAKVNIRQRQQHGQMIEPPSRPDGPADAACNAELVCVLDEEIRRLPERYRLPLVLCYLLGRSNAEAARELGWPKGTVAVCLARARERLRRRLSKHGFAGLAALPVTPASDPIPGGIGLSTHRPPAAPAVELANGVMTSMLFDKCKAALFLVLAGGLFAVAGVGSRSLLAQPPEQATPPELEIHLPLPAHFETVTGKLSDLLKSREQTAKIEFDQRYEQFYAGRGETDLVIAAAQRLLRASLETRPSKDKRTAIWQEQAERTKKIYDVNVARFKGGRCSIADMAESRYYYEEALIALERLKSP